MSTILLVDDDPNFLAWLRGELEERGHAVRAAARVVDARAALAESRPDLVIVGLVIEEADDGFALCYHIKKQDASIPVILATEVTGETVFDFGSASASERAWIKADVILDRPFRFEQLEREMERLMDRSQDRLPT
jgi:DNA-binding response OmpR family regulator